MISPAKNEAVLSALFDLPVLAWVIEESGGVDVSARWCRLVALGQYARNLAGVGDEGAPFSFLTTAIGQSLPIDLQHS